MERETQDTERCTYADEYQRLAARTLIDRPDFEISDDNFMIVWNALGLAGEAGEVVDHIKKGIMHQRGIDREYIKRELGDLAWYFAGLCTNFGFAMSDVFETNVRKLEARYPDGYSAERSAVREGEAR
jgi:NTP pyrophosphatase (non-canonical NTP hydrolase)